MSINAFDAALAGESVLVTETRMEELQLLGRVGSTSFVIAGSAEIFAESLNPMSSWAPRSDHRLR